MNELEKQQLRELLEWKKSLESSHSIPLNIDQALIGRGYTKTSPTPLTVSSKGVDTEDVTVTESGSASYAVMNDPDGFLQVTIAGTIYYLPYFS